jgi:DNA-binding transcriptional LysR family regulator
MNRKKLSLALAHFAARAPSLLEVRLDQSGSLLELVLQGGLQLM